MTSLAQDSAMAVLSRRVRVLRGERGWSAHDLAREAGVGVASVYRAEHGRDVRLSTAGRIAGALGVPLPGLLGGDCGHCRECGAKDPEVTR